MDDFSKLSTVQFQEIMKPAALKIYQQVFEGCTVEYLNGNNGKAHVLDQHFGIDALIHLPSGQWISVQEKYREFDAIKYLDFTQEYMNSHGQQNESKGEFSKLGAQLYFYGWADQSNNKFEKWFLMDVLKYKLTINAKGGLDEVGKLKQNEKHGSASFYSIPLKTIKNCFITDYRDHGIHKDWIQEYEKYDTNPPK